MATVAEMNAVRSAIVAHRYGGQAYTPVALDAMSNKQLSSELSKARSILRKRFERAGGLYTPSQAQRIQSLLEPVKNIPMDRRAEVLSQIARELSGGYTTKGEARTRREEILSGFQDAGYDFITNENLSEFLEFADEFSWKERDKLFGSGVLLKYFNQQAERREAGESVKISKHSFMIWLSKQEGRYGSGESYRSGGKR